MPPSVLLACVALMVAGAIVGLQPLWASPQLSLAAVAHAGDTASVYRMLHSGADPNRAGDVAMSSTTVSLTPLEAAVESRQVETVQVLLRAGVRIADAAGDTAGDTAVPRLVCLARASSAGEVERFLQTTYHVQPSEADCSRMQLPPN